MGIYDKNNSQSATQEAPKTRKIVYVDGVSISVMRKIARFEFGDTVHSVTITGDGRSFNIILTKDFPDWQKAKFTNYWKVAILIAT